MSEAHADDLGSEADIDDLFPFLLVEKDQIDTLVTTIRAALPSLEPAELQKMATFLFALERLPYATPRVSMNVAIMERIDENLSYVSVEIGEEAFRLSTGGYVYTPGAGGDSYSKTNFEVETGGFREGTTEDFENWLDAFRVATGTYEIDGSSEDDVDLSEGVVLDGWDRLEAYWESRGGGGEFGY